VADVLVVGGYGRVGAACVRELLATTDVGVVVAGRNAQRAQSAVMSLGERATPLYLDASDARTLSHPLEDAAAIVLACGGAPHAALELALRVRVPVVCLAPLRLDAHAAELLAARAWDAQVALILGAGAVPGLAGVAAEWLLRQFAELEEIVIACSGPWSATQSARRDLAALRVGAPASERRFAGLWPRQWAFPAPVGRRLVRAAEAMDLERFSEQHCVRRVTWLERDERPAARLAERLLQRPAQPGFALLAQAFVQARSARPDATLVFEAPDVPAAAAAACGALVRTLLAGGVPAGVLQPREVLNPASFVDALSKRGVRVRA
jgi:NAD(P)-dependent dehydrogenase (short-subunit alcohol dehydrogenase family)